MRPCPHPEAFADPSQGRRCLASKPPRDSCRVPRAPGFESLLPPARSRSSPDSFSRRFFSTSKSVSAWATEMNQKYTLAAKNGRPRLPPRRTGRCRAYQGRCWWRVQERGEQFPRCAWRKPRRIPQRRCWWSAWRQPIPGIRPSPDMGVSIENSARIPHDSLSGSPGGSRSHHLRKIGRIRSDSLGPRLPSGLLSFALIHLDRFDPPNASLRSPGRQFRQFYFDRFDSP